MSMSAPSSIEDETTDHAGQRDAMDRMYRLQRHIYDATRRFYLLGRERLIAELDVPPGGSVLEIGCGTGRNLVKVALAYPTARVHGFDISSEMLKTAGSAIVKAGLTDRISLAEGDALTFSAGPPFGITAFDRIYLSYTLSMIPDWQGAVAHAASLLAPDGSLHIADFGQCEGLSPTLRNALFWWLRRFDVTPRADLRAVLSAEAHSMDVPYSFHATYGGYAWNLVLGPVEWRKAVVGETGNSR